MRKNNLIWMISVSILMSFITISCSAQLSKSIETNVEVENVQNELNFLASDELEGRETGTAGIEKAAEFLETKFRDFGVKPYFEDYRDDFTVNGISAFNIVGVVPGNDPQLKDEYILVGAHYDHIGHGKPVEGDEIANGANDNAAGTVGVLELAREFAERNVNKRSVIFALFSGEEMGLRGSAHLANKLKEQGVDLYTVFNLEMIGVPMKAKDYQAYVTGYEMSNLAEKFNEYSGEKILGFLPQAGQMNLFRRSDNYPFFKEFNIPSQTISTFDFSNYPYYHHVDDEAEFLNAEFIAGLIENLIPGLLTMANTSDKEIKLKK